MPELPGHTKLEKMRNMNEKLTLKQELIIIKERLWPKHLTTIGKIKHLGKKIVEPILNIDVFTFTGVFVGIILMFYLPYIQAMTIGILGFIVYLRIEHTMIAVAIAKKK